MYVFHNHIRYITQLYAQGIQERTDRAAVRLCGDSRDILLHPRSGDMVRSAELLRLRHDTDIRAEGSAE